jgi:hypothetical protein
MSQEPADCSLVIQSEGSYQQCGFMVDPVSVDP